MKDDRLIFEDIIEYIKKNKLDPATVFNVIKREFAYSLPSAKYNSGHRKTAWKMMKFQLYLWKRLEGTSRDSSITRAETVRKLVNSPEYERAYKMFPNPAFDAERESKNLTQLIAERKQDKYFMAKNYHYPGRPTEQIPQKVINKLR